MVQRDLHDTDPGPDPTVDLQATEVDDPTVEDFAMPSDTMPDPWPAAMEDESWDEENADPQLWARVLRRLDRRHMQRRRDRELVQAAHSDGREFAAYAGRRARTPRPVAYASSDRRWRSRRTTPRWMEQRPHGIVLRARRARRWPWAIRLSAGGGLVLVSAWLLQSVAPSEATVESRAAASAKEVPVATSMPASWSERKEAVAMKEVRATTTAPEPEEGAIGAVRAKGRAVGSGHAWSAQDCRGDARWGGESRELARGFDAHDKLF